MAKWTAFAHAGDYNFDVARLKKQWHRLHAGDAEPLPEQAAVLEAWVLFHNGEFQRAAEAGLAAGDSGTTVANKAACVHATYLEKKEKARLDLYLEAAQRAAAQAAREPANPNAWYLQAYALGRYSQGISVAKALAQGLGTKVKAALEQCIALQPRHADAHVALGTFHAEVIDKVGSLIGGMTYGARKDIGLRMFQEALKIHPGSAIAMIEYANGMVMLEGDKRMKEATRLYEQAAAVRPLGLQVADDRLLLVGPTRHLDARSFAYRRVGAVGGDDECRAEHATVGQGQACTLGRAFEVGEWRAQQLDSGSARGEQQGRGDHAVLDDVAEIRLAQFGGIEAERLAPRRIRGIPDDHAFVGTGRSRRHRGPGAHAA